MLISARLSPPAARLRKFFFLKSVISLESLEFLELNPRPRGPELTVPTTVNHLCNQCFALHIHADKNYSPRLVLGLLVNINQGVSTSVMFHVA